MLDLLLLPLLFSFAFANTLYLLLLDFDAPKVFGAISSFELEFVVDMEFS